MAENDFENDVKSFLAAIGYVYSDSDGWMLSFCADKVINTVKNECNVTSVPDGLRQAAVQMAAGEFLYAKKNAGQTDGFEGIDFSAAAKSVQEGDTNVTFAIGEGCSTPEQRLDKLTAYLMSSGKSEFVTYRRLKW